MDQLEKDTYLDDVYKGMDKLADGSEELRRQASVAAILENANSKRVSAEAEKLRAEAEIKKAEAEEKKAKASFWGTALTVAAGIVTTVATVIFALGHEKTVYDNHKENNYITDKDQARSIDTINNQVYKRR